MKATRWVCAAAVGIVGLVALTGCETQRSACEREKRLTSRMEEMQVDLDQRIGGVNQEMANLRSNPPVVVSPAPLMPEPQIRIEDSGYNPPKVALYPQEEVIYSPPPAKPAAGKGAIRVPVPATTVQAALKEAGFYHGPIDGKPGRQTVAAITAFQRSQGLKADGVVGRATWARLQGFAPAGMPQTRLK